jgi:hydrogenase maturation factor
MSAAAVIPCSSCRAPMDVIGLQNHFGAPLEIDVCWPCHAIWFDNLESISLSPASVIELFKRIHEHRSGGRNTVSLRPACPKCRAGLALTNDMGKSGRFSYHRCPAGHGRFTSFAQFLREKQFVRTLQPNEIAQMKVSIRQVRCSSCGASIDLAGDTACSHCGSAISVLDEGAVQRALEALQQREVAKARPDALAVGDAILAGQTRPPPDSAPWWARSVHHQSGLADLIDVGIDAVFSRIFR